MTNTPRPTAASTATATPTARPFIIPVPGGDCTAAQQTMHTSPGTSLASRDINVPGRLSGNIVVSPANNAEVVIVDPAGSDLASASGSENNEGLGNFAAIRIPHTSIPQSVINSNATFTSPGYLWMGFAHLDRINVSEGSILNSGDPIGIIGNTGLRSDAAPDDRFANAHLHLTMFYIPSGGKFRYDQFGLSGARLFNTIGDDPRAVPSGVVPPLIVDANNLWPMSSCR